MGSLERRLERLEGRAGRFNEDEEERIEREAISRLTDQELELVWEYLKRAEGEEEAEPRGGEERAAIERYFQLREEVRDEFRAPVK